MGFRRNGNVQLFQGVELQTFPYQIHFSSYLDDAAPVFISSAILALDSTTFLILRKKYKTATLHKPNSKINKEIMFYVQSVSQVSVFFFCSIFYIFLSRYATTAWPLFLCTTVSCTVMHSLEGIIMVVFHVRLAFRSRSTTVKAFPAPHVVQIK
ncbi:hypothetical protein PMAYCL1PPCAC_15034 [Pristionchus mayeri]|uniref:7TM GPCR serpentine receptor class x (Srx) domain-containing protein n=1 Tax=Pristionchus mayeri TaxID=1317129 RepID=A0AAN5CI69_9BILA|nr:hypothetical protein PMAYCL1PPCAC_15034 [Pristionchus mayeri]